MIPAMKAGGSVRLILTSPARLGSLSAAPTFAAASPPGLLLIRLHVGPGYGSVPVMRNTASAAARTIRNAVTAVARFMHRVKTAVEAALPRWVAILIAVCFVIPGFVDDFAGLAVAAVFLIVQPVRIRRFADAWRAYEGR